MDEADVEVEVEGMLAKLKHKPTPFTSPWNNRYFDVRRLKGRNNPLALTYRESRKSKNIKGWIYLSEVQSIRKVSSVDNCMVGPTASVQPHSKLISAIGDHEGRVFEIEALSRLFIVRAVDRHVDEWVEPLQRLCLQARDEEGVVGSVGTDTSAGHVLRTGKTVRRVNTGSSLRAGAGAGDSGDGDGVDRRGSVPIRLEEGQTWVEEGEEEEEEEERSRHSSRRAPTGADRRAPRSSRHRAPPPRWSRRRGGSRSRSRSASGSESDSPRSDSATPPSSRDSGHKRRSSRRRQHREAPRREASSRSEPYHSDSDDDRDAESRRACRNGQQGDRELRRRRREEEEEEEEEEEGDELRASASRAKDARASRDKRETRKGSGSGSSSVRGGSGGKGSGRAQEQGGSSEARAQTGPGSREGSGSARAAAPAPRDAGRPAVGSPIRRSSRLVPQGAVREGWRTSSGAGEEEEGVRKGPRRPSPTPNAVRPSMGVGRRSRAVAPSVVHAEKSLEDEFSDDEVDVLQEMLQQEDTQSAAVPASVTATRTGTLEDGRWGEDSMSEEEGGAAEESLQEERQRVVDQALAEEKGSPHRPKAGAVQEEGKAGDRNGKQPVAVAGADDDDDDDWDKEMESEEEEEGGEEKGEGTAPGRGGPRGKLGAGVRVDEDFVTADWDDEDDEE